MRKSATTRWFFNARLYGIGASLLVAAFAATASAQEIGVEPESMDVYYTPGTDPAAETLTISNAGNEVLNYSVSGDKDWFDLWPLGGTVEPGDADVVEVNFWVDGEQGHLEGVITVVDDDAVAPDATVAVTVWDMDQLAPPEFTTHPEDVAVPVGRDAEFVAMAEGDPEPQYQWQKLDEDVWTNIADATAPTLVIESVTEVDAGTYRVVAENEVDSVNSDAAQLTVQPVVAFPYQQSFEAPLALGAVPADFDWVPGEGDSSIVIEHTYGFTDRPLTDDMDQSQVLQLGAQVPLRVYFDMATEEYPDIYLDQMMRISPFGGDLAENEALDDPEAKLALYMNDEENLVLFHGDDAGQNVFTILDGQFTPEEWYRVTVSMNMAAAEPDFQLQINGAIQAAGGVDTFRFANSAYQEAEELDRKLSWAALMGDEMIDDFVLTSVDPEVDPVDPVAPEITEQPADPGAVNVGDSVEFSVTATGYPAPNYQWRFDSVDIEEATDATYSIAAVQLEDAGDYDVVVSNTEGDVTSDAVTLVVYQAPEFVEQPEDQAVYPGEDATFNALAEGYPEVTYAWFKDNEPITGGTDGVLLIESAQSEDAGTYHVVAENTGGTTTSDSATLSLLAPEFGDDDHPLDQRVPVGDTATFSVTIGGPEATYQWFKDDVELEGETDATLTIDPVTLGDAGGYHVVVTNTEGEATSDVAHLLVAERFGLPYQQSFEPPDILAGDAPVDFGWMPGEGDSSIVIEHTYEFADRPLTVDADQSQVLQLGAQTPLRVYFDMANQQYSDVYLDQMMQLAPVGGDPAENEALDDPEVKMALFMDDAENLVLFHGDDAGQENVFTTLDGQFTSEQWYRVTVSMDMAAAEPDFQLQINGEIQSAAGVDTFRFANSAYQATEELDRKVNWVAMGGTEMIDDFVLTADSTFDFFTISTQLTGAGRLEVDGQLVESPYAVQVDAGEPVEIHYIAEDYRVIDELTSAGELVATAAGEETYIWQKASVDSNILNEVVFVDLLWDVDGKTPEWWRIEEAGGVVEDGEHLTVYQGYLLNQTDLDAPFVITDFGFDEAGHPYVKWVSTGVANGDIEVHAVAELGDGPNMWPIVNGETEHDAGVNTWTGDEPADAITPFYAVVISEPEE